MFIIQKTEHFEKWFRKLKDVRAKAIILARLKKAELGNLSNYKSVGKKVFEMKIDYGPGYRIYYMHKGDITLLLIAGGTKSSQARDIKKAQKIAAEIGGE